MGTKVIFHQKSRNTHEIIGILTVHGNQLPSFWPEPGLRFRKIFQRIWYVISQNCPPCELQYLRVAKINNINTLQFFFFFFFFFYPNNLSGHKNFAASIFLYKSLIDCFVSGGLLKFFLVGWLVLGHINPCKLFNTESCLSY